MHLGIAVSLPIECPHTDGLGLAIAPDLNLRGESKTLSGCCHDSGERLSRAVRNWLRDRSPPLAIGATTLDKIKNFDWRELCLVSSPLKK